MSHAGAALRREMVTTLKAAKAAVWTSKTPAANILATATAFDAFALRLRALPDPDDDDTRAADIAIVTANRMRDVVATAARKPAVGSA